MTGEAKTLVAISLVTLLLFVGGIMALTRRTAPETNQTIDPAVLVREDSQRLGATAETAKVTLVEFSDLECPYCAQAEPALKTLVADYPELSLVFRHFPLLQHQYAVLAAEAAEAAGAQGKFWEMTDLIFAGQANWSASSDALPIFRSYAEELALDLAQFDQALADHSFRAKVQQGVADGNAAKVNSTPTFFLDGEKFTGSAAQLKTAIEAKLQ